MKFTAKLYDSEGNEIQVKPDHMVIMGRDWSCQVPIDDYEVKMVYLTPDGEKVEIIRAEFGSLFDVKFVTNEDSLT